MINEAGDTISIHTNNIEGAWRHVKDCLRRGGSSAALYFSYLAEYMWNRNYTPEMNRVDAFWECVQSMYNLNAPFEPSKKPLFAIESIEDTLIEFNSNAERQSSRNADDIYLQAVENEGANSMWLTGNGRKGDLSRKQQLPSEKITKRNSF